MAHNTQEVQTRFVYIWFHESVVYVWSPNEIGSCLLYLLAQISRVSLVVTLLLRQERERHGWGGQLGRGNNRFPFLSAPKSVESDTIRRAEIEVAAWEYILQVQLTLRNEYDPAKVPSSPCPFVRNKSTNVLHKRPIIWASLLPSTRSTPAARPTSLRFV